MENAISESKKFPSQCPKMGKFLSMSSGVGYAVNAAPHRLSIHFMTSKQSRLRPPRIPHWSSLARNPSDSRPRAVRAKTGFWTTRDDRSSSALQEVRPLPHRCFPLLSVPRLRRRDHRFRRLWRSCFHRRGNPSVTSTRKPFRVRGAARAARGSAARYQGV